MYVCMYVCMYVLSNYAMSYKYGKCTRVKFAFSFFFVAGRGTESFTK